MENETKDGIFENASVGFAQFEARYGTEPRQQAPNLRLLTFDGPIDESPHDADLTLVEPADEEAPPRPRTGPRFYCASSANK